MTHLPTHHLPSLSPHSHPLQHSGLHHSMSHPNIHLSHHQQQQQQLSPTLLSSGYSSSYHTQDSSYPDGSSAANSSAAMLRRRGSQPYPSPHAHYASYHQRSSISYPSEDDYAHSGSPVEEDQVYEDEVFYRQQQQQQHARAQQAQQQSSQGAQGQQQANYFPPTPTSAGWEHTSHPAHEMHAMGMGGNMGQLAYPDEDAQEEPLLTSHVSLGSNRLPPDSTLLTALPGFGGFEP